MDRRSFLLRAAQVAAVAAFAPSILTEPAETLIELGPLPDSVFTPSPMFFGDAMPEILEPGYLTLPMLQEAYSQAVKYALGDPEVLIMPTVQYQTLRDLDYVRS